MFRTVNSEENWKQTASEGNHLYCEVPDSLYESSCFLKCKACFPGVRVTVY